MQNPLDVLASVATRERSARNNAAVKLQSKARAKVAKRRVNALRSNAKIPSQVTALSKKLPKDVIKHMSAFLIKRAGKTQKNKKNKKGGDGGHPEHLNGGMGCGSHGSKKPRRIGKPTKKKRRKGKY